MRVVNLLVINPNTDWTRATKLYGDLYHGKMRKLYVALRPGPAGVEAQARVTCLLPNCAVRIIRETKAHRLIQCQYMAPSTPTSTFPKAA